MSSKKDTCQSAKEECFVIMPISDPEGYEKGHFERVYKDIFTPAIVKAGYIPRRADEEKGTNLIHLEILRKLIESPLAICDLSSRNPNVLFELGIRQAFNKPVVLVQEVGTPKIFDISPLRYVDYRKERIYHQVVEDQDSIYEAIVKTVEEWEKGITVNSIVDLLPLIQPANLPEASDAKLDPMFQLIMSELSQVKEEIRNSRVHSIEESTVKELESGLRRYNRFERIVHDVCKNGDFDQTLLEELRRMAVYYYRLAKKTNNLQYRELGRRYDDLCNIVDEASNMERQVGNDN